MATVHAAGRIPRFAWSRGAATDLASMETEEYGNPKFFLTVSEGAHLTKDIIAKLETYVTDGVDFGDGKDPAVVTGDAAKIKGWFDIIYEPAVFEANAKAKECCCIV